MDEREAHDLLSTAADSVSPSADLAARAERKYASRRARLRAVSALVVIAVVGSGVATAAVISRKTASPPVAEPTPATISLTPLSSGSTTTTTSSTTVPHLAVAPTAVRAMSFVDANVGFGLVDNVADATSNAVRTDDGGRTWKRLGALIEAEAGIHFENATDGVAWGNGPLEATTDGGATWHDGGGPVDNYLAWAGGRMWAMTPCVQSTPCGSRWLLISDDAGRTWQQTAPLQQGLGAATIIATSRSTAYVAEPATDQQTGGPWQLAATTDGGASWTYHPVPCPTWTQSPSLASNGQILVLTCAGLPPGSKTTTSQLLTSTDDGATWRQGAQFLGNMSVSNIGSTFQAVTSAGLVHSTDGRNWRASGFSDGDLVLTPPVPAVGAWLVVSGARSLNGIWFSRNGTRWVTRAIAPPG